MNKLIPVLSVLGVAQSIIKTYSNRKETDVCDREARKNLYDRIRTQIEHEDSLINQRLTWLLLTQGFLFLAYSTLITDDRNVKYKTGVLCIVGGFGFFFSLSTFISIVAAFDSLKILRETWSDSTLTANKRYLAEEGYPQIIWFGKRGYHEGVGASGMLPILTMLVWASLVTLKLYTEKALKSQSYYAYTVASVVFIIAICCFIRLYKVSRRRTSS